MHVAGASGIKVEKLTMVAVSDGEILTNQLPTVVATPVNGSSWFGSNRIAL
jgi:hypothetical protein